VALVTFIVAYVRRTDTEDVGNWLFFLLVVSGEAASTLSNPYLRHR